MPWGPPGYLPNWWSPVGGDGWMLASIHDLGPDWIYLGVNAGRLGFLLNDADVSKPEELTALVRCLEEGTYGALSFPLIEMVAERAVGGPAIRATAINDCYVERITGNMALVRLRVDGKIVIDQLACDGIIVATALGSTAYSFSAGGVPSHPMAAALHVTPICAHAPRLSPFVLPLQSEVEVEVLRSDHRPVRAFSDGIDHGAVTRATVRPTGEHVRLAFLPGHDLTATLVRKILNS